MKPELERVKSDLHTMERALGISAAMGRDWIRWMKRDRWIGLWWCLPGLILIAGALLPVDRARAYFGLVADQWIGLLVCAVLLSLASFLTRKVTAEDGRPAGLIREVKRVNGMSSEGLWFSIALVVQLALYFVWAEQHGIAFKPFWAGMFIVMGSSCLVGAVSAKAWPLLGWAIPFIAYGLSLPLVDGHRLIGGILFGLMFIAVAFSFSIIAVLQIRMLERQNDSN